VEGTQTRKSGIDKPDVQDGQRSSLPEGGHLEECGHGYQGGKGCYLCDPNHTYRLKESVKA
ncbi:hypothetical protein, partial [Bradyrhizobium cosmicum]|uniref:hypothetical protein n=1 Tax=Bradyrhizobium cosmicum TaxID=1404864 RepID=UPI0028F0F6B8